MNERRKIRDDGQCDIHTSLRITTFVKNYPIPIFGIIGLLVGSIFHWTPNQQELGHWIWFVTLVVGGAPIVWQTMRDMLHRHFASDIVALLAIVAAILMNNAFPGLVTNLTVFELTVSPSPRDFMKTILHKIGSNLIGVSTNSFP